MGRVKILTLGRSFVINENRGNFRGILKDLLAVLGLFEKFNKKWF